MPKAIVYPLFGKIKVEYLFDQMTLGMPSIRMLNIKKENTKTCKRFFFFLEFTLSLIFSSRNISIEFIKTSHMMYLI